MSTKVPGKEAELIAFVEAIIGGFKADPDIFKAPPYTYEHLASLIDTANISIDSVAQGKSLYEAAVETKNKDTQNLRDAAIEAADYAYKVAKRNKSILAKVGLTPRWEKKSAELPGQARTLIIAKQEIGKVIFKWKQPTAGGKVGAYIIQRKETETPPEDWKNLWTSMSKEAEINDQPENQSFDYRVRALNHTGIGAPSNTVTVKF